MLVLRSNLGYCFTNGEATIYNIGPRFHLFMQRPVTLILVLQAYTVTSYGCHPDFFDIYACLVLPAMDIKPSSISLRYPK